MANFLDSTPLGGMFYNPKKDEEKALEALRRGYGIVDNIQSPEYTPVEYQAPEYVGDYTPEEAQAALMGQSAYEGISLDPEMRSAQTAQIGALERLRDEGGFNLTDRANLQKIQNDELMKERGQRGAIMQDARARGMSGSGMELMSLLGSNQAGMNRQSQRDLEIAGMAQDRALQAGGQAANLAGNVRGQDWQQEASKAAAQDAVSKFNSSMMNNTNQFNVSNNMRAGMTNQGLRQGVANQTATIGNEQQRMNQFVMPQQSYTDKLAKARMQVQGGEAESKIYQDQARAKQIQQGELWGGLNKIGMGMLNKIPFGSGGSKGGSGSGGQQGGGVSGSPEASNPYVEYSDPNFNSQTGEYYPEDDQERRYSPTTTSFGY